MLPDDAEHAACVDAWLGAEQERLPPSQLVALFERALAALWRRAEMTLGEVTLAAIVDRVLYVASESHPCVASLKLMGTGLYFDDFRREGGEDANLREVVRLVLTELLTVVGHLTDEIMTPALHAELSKVALDEPASGDDQGGALGTRS